MQAALHPERSSNRWTFTNTSGTNTAYKEGCLPSWLSLGTIDGCSPSPGDGGVEAEGHKRMGSSLDNFSRSNPSMLSTPQVWVQEGVQQRKVQMCQGIPSVHCPLPMWWIMFSEVETFILGRYDYVLFPECYFSSC
jgi:hypothetical protein